MIVYPLKSRLLQGVAFWKRRSRFGKDRVLGSPSIHRGMSHYAASWPGPAPRAWQRERQCCTGTPNPTPRNGGNETPSPRRCTACGRRGHTEAQCWERHPHLRPAGKGRGTGDPLPNGIPAGATAPGHPPPGGPNRQVPYCPECGKGRQTPELCWQKYPELREAAMRAGKAVKGRGASRSKGQYSCGRWLGLDAQTPHHQSAPLCHLRVRSLSAALHRQLCTLQVGVGLEVPRPPRGRTAYKHEIELEVPVRITLADDSRRSTQVLID